MRNPAKSTFRAMSAVAIVLGSLNAIQVFAADISPADEGKVVAENRQKGNCFACHDYPGAVLPGNVGPKLVNMKARYPDKDKLRAQVWDATKNNPNTIMPPFGKNRILTEKEIDAIVEFLYTL